MSTLKLAATTVVAALIAIVPATSAHGAYEDPAIDVDVSPTTLVGGGSFSGTATSNGVDCEWTVTFRGEDITGTGTEIDFEFDTPTVDEETERDLDVTCVYDDENVSNSAADAGVASAEFASYRQTSATLPTALQTLTRTVTITLLAASDGDEDDDDDDDDGGGSSNGSLPDTGGTSGIVLLSGATLVAAGAGVILTVRRRRSEVQ